MENKQTTHFMSMVTEFGYFRVLYTQVAMISCATLKEIHFSSRQKQTVEIQLLLKPTFNFPEGLGRRLLPSLGSSPNISL